MARKKGPAKELALAEAGKIVEVRSVLQNEAAEAGAASFAMALGQLGRNVRLDEVRNACGVSRDGGGLENLVLAAPKFGVAVERIDSDVDGLRRLVMPLLAAVGRDHVVVVEGFGDNWIQVNDPAGGRRRQLIAEFQQQYAGQVLKLSRGQDFKSGGAKESLTQVLKSQMATEEGAFLFIVVASVLMLIPVLIAPAFQQIFIDYFLIGGMVTWIVPLLVIMGITAIASGVLTYLREWYMVRLETRIAVVRTARFMWHILRLPIFFFIQRHPAQISGRVPMNGKIAKALVTGAVSGSVNVLTIVIFAVFLAQYSWVLAAIGIGFALSNLVLLIVVGARIGDAARKAELDMLKSQSAIMQGLQMIDSLKASGTEDVFFSMWAGHNVKNVNNNQELGVYFMFVVAVPVLTSGLSTVLILSLGGLYVMQGAMTIGLLVAFQTLLARFATPVQQVLSVIPPLQQMRGQATLVTDAQSAEVSPEFHEELPVASPHVARPAVPRLKLSGRLSVRNLTFGYNELQPPLIKDFSFDLEAGARVALVGGSGSGKSTVAKLVSGLIKPWSGEILYDDIPIEEIPRRVLRNSIAVVDQNIVLFEATIRDNIGLWDDTMPDQRLVRATQDAEIYDEVMARTDAFYYRVEENGRNFSGGQRQRLEIARALATDPSILFMDEGTSALDPLSERKVIENLRRRGCSCLIVAHRLSTIRDADEIIVMHQGKILQRGTHESMKDVDGPYRRLIET